MQFDKSITNTARTLLLAIVAYFGVATSTHAATAVSGAISASTTWTLAQSPYRVTADVSVENGATLSIEAGVVVNFDAAKNLTVTNGALNARGTAGQPIVFTSALDAAGSTPAPGDWGQIRFLNGSNDTATILEYAQIRYGHGIDVQSAAPSFNYLDISNNLGAAISIDLDSSPKGIGNQASGNTLNGVSVPAGDVLGSVTWGIKGIPYVVASGIVSVGNSPAISTLNISEIQQGETLNAIINGIRLAGAQSVGISTAGTSAILQNGATDTSVPIQLTASSNAALGASNIELQVAAGRPALIGALQVIQPQPTLTNLAPNSLYASQAGSALTVTGKNFMPESVIQIDGIDLTTTYASANTLSATLPALTAGNKSITVKQPDPLSAGSFLISKPAVLSVTVPQLFLSPASVNQIQGQPLTLTVSIPSPAPIGGITVNLSSNAPAIAGVPASVVIPEGTTSTTVMVSTNGSGSVSISASAPGFADSISLITLNGIGRRYALIPNLTTPTSSSTIGTASASSSYEVAPNGVFSAFDNNAPGRWVTNTTAIGHWLKWSFVTAHTVTEFEYTTGNNLYTQLQYSDDDVNWFGASAVYQEGQGNFIHPSATGATPHRFWRLYVSQVYGATVANWYGYDKFQLYSDVPLATTAVGSYSTYLPQMGTDGTLATGWNSGRFAPAWIAIDLGIVRPISEVRVYAGTGWPVGITNYDIQVSSDGVSWTTVAQASNGAYWTITPVTATGRYVRLQINSHTGGSWIALAEFQVY